MLKGWRTILVNVLIVLAGIAAYLDTSALGSILPANYAWLPIAVGVVNIALRTITTTPMGVK